MRAVRRLSHPNIVPVFEADEAEGQPGNKTATHWVAVGTPARSSLAGRSYFFGPASPAGIWPAFSAALVSLLTSARAAVDLGFGAFIVSPVSI